MAPGHNALAGQAEPSATPVFDGTSVMSDPRATLTVRSPFRRAAAGGESMRWTNEKLNDVFERTNGYCHICGKQLALTNYGKPGRRGAWEIEHSKARANGGTDHGNNLYAACIRCNRTKRDGSTRAARAFHGRTAAPLSAKKQATVRKKNALVLGGSAAVGAVLLGVAGPAALFVAGVGAAIGHDLEPDPQKGKRRRR